MKARSGAATARQDLGRWGERLAEEQLARLGYQILDRNYRTPYGELDLVALLPGSDAVVFVEVKTRRSSVFGLPEASITESKKAHLLAAAQAYLLAHPGLPGDWRIDVIAILAGRGKGEIEWVHFENAVTGN